MTVTLRQINMIPPPSFNLFARGHLHPRETPRECVHIVLLATFNISEYFMEHKRSLQQFFRTQNITWLKLHIKSVYVLISFVV